MSNLMVWCSAFTVCHSNTICHLRAGGGRGAGGRVGGSVYSLIRRTFVEFAQNLTPEKSHAGRRKA